MRWKRRKIHFKSNPELRFEMYLARELRMTLSEMRRKMSSAEFAKWVAFYNVENQEQEKARKDAERKAKRKR